MNDTCETVKVVSDDHAEGFKVINKSDFKDGEHELHGMQRQGQETAQEVTRRGPGRPQKQ